MRIGYFSKVGAAVTAFFTPSTFQLSGGPETAKELVPTKSVAIIGKSCCSAPLVLSWSELSLFITLGKSLSRKGTVKEATLGANLNRKMYTTEGWKKRVTRVRVVVVIAVVLGDNQPLLTRVRVTLITLCPFVIVIFFSHASSFTHEPGLTQFLIYATPLPLSLCLSPLKIGAGAGGASTAFYLQKLLQPPGEPLHKHQLLHPTTITIFDQSDKIGGRCQVFFTTNPADPENGKPEQEVAIEVGASIFVKVNHHLADSSKEFGLKVKKLDDELVAIWDGDEFLFTESSWRFWSILKGLARWGLAPIKVSSRVLRKGK